MELIKLKSLNLTMEESRDIINFIAQKRGISTKKLLSTIKPNLKRKNLIKKLIKRQKKSNKNKSATKIPQNLTYEKPSKLAKRENLTSQKQQILSIKLKQNRNYKRKT